MPTGIPLSTPLTFLGPNRRTGGSPAASSHASVRYGQLSCSTAVTAVAFCTTISVPTRVPCRGPAVADMVLAATLEHGTRIPDHAGAPSTPLMGQRGPCKKEKSGRGSVSMWGVQQRKGCVAGSGPMPTCLLPVPVACACLPVCLPTAAPATPVKPSQACRALSSALEAPRAARPVVFRPWT